MMSQASAVEPSADLVAALSLLVAGEGRSWFPDLGPGPLQHVLVGGVVRARCFLYRFELSDGARAREIMVKVRHSRPDLRRENRFSDRPILAPVRTISDEDSARLEYEGLRLIAKALDGADGERFGVLRPLAELPEHAAIVTDVVAHPTLRARLLGTSRFRVGRRKVLGPRPWQNAGAWLRTFHGQPASPHLTPLGETPDQVGGLLCQFADFLRDRVGCRALLDELADAGVDLARHALPVDLPLGTAHGDFTATNIFAAAGGQVTVFDPLPLWRASVFQDLATLLVGVRVHPLQASSLGLALPAATLDDYEAAVLRGYFGDDAVPSRALSTIQLLVLLDRWAALLSNRAPRGAGRAQLHEARVRLASRHYEAEAQRLHAVAAAGPGMEGESSPSRSGA